MRRAIDLARRGLGRTGSNPSVGCVIVLDGRCIGRGVTADGGRPHAETMALAQAGPNAAGATAYVTLEPCAHTGQTPPCADALINAGLERIVIAQRDPDPRVNGGGIARLVGAGLSCTLGVLENHARDVTAGFLSRIQNGRPFVTLKLATTLDGRIAMATGESRWITQSAARRATHMLRSQHDAVLVGSGTVASDNPMLDVRDMGSLPSPVRVIVTGSKRLPDDCRLLQTATQIPVWIISSGTDTLQSLPGVTHVPAAIDDGKIQMSDALEHLAKKGINRILCEGGGRIAASLLNADLVDEVVLFQAGKVIGASGVASIAEIARPNLAAVPKFDLISTNPVGPDQMSIWRRRSAD